MEFVALDVELANPNPHSICQVGIVGYQDGQLVELFSSLVDPQEPFYGLGIRKHSIDEAAVRGKPTFAEIAHEINDALEGRICLSHGGV